MNRTSQRPPDELARIVTDTFTEPYWAAARDSRLTCAQCADCRHFRSPPSPFCPKCRSQRLNWPTLPGTGTIYSFTVVERAVLPGTEASVPYVVAVVSLDGADDARIISNVLDAPIEDISIGRQVRAVFDTIPGGAVIPRFVLDDPNCEGSAP